MDARVPALSAQTGLVFVHHGYWMQCARVLRRLLIRDMFILWKFPSDLSSHSHVFEQDAENEEAEDVPEEKMQQEDETMGAEKEEEMPED